MIYKGINSIRELLNMLLTNSRFFYMSEKRKATNCFLIGRCLGIVMQTNQMIDQELKSLGYVNWLGIYRIYFNTYRNLRFINVYDFSQYLMNSFCQNF